MQPAVDVVQPNSPRWSLRRSRQRLQRVYEPTIDIQLGPLTSRLLQQCRTHVFISFKAIQDAKPAGARARRTAGWDAEGDTTTPEG